MLCAEAGVDVDLQLTLHAPAVVNDPGLTEIVAGATRRWVGQANVSSGPPWPPSDDISEFRNHVPGCYIFAGAAALDLASPDISRGEPAPVTTKSLSGQDPREMI